MPCQSAATAPTSLGTIGSSMIPIPMRSRLQRSYLYEVSSGRRVPLSHCRSPEEYRDEWRSDPSEVQSCREEGRHRFSARRRRPATAPDSHRGDRSDVVGWARGASCCDKLAARWLRDILRCRMLWQASLSRLPSTTTSSVGLSMSRLRNGIFRSRQQEQTNIRWTAAPL